MAKFVEGTSHTFDEYLLLPGLTTKKNIPDNVSLKTPLVKFKKATIPTFIKNLFIIPSNISLSGAGMELSRRENYHIVLQETLKDVVPWFDSSWLWDACMFRTDDAWNVKVWAWQGNDIRGNDSSQIIRWL